MLGAKERESDQIIKPTVRQKSAQIREHYKELRLSMEGEYAVVFINSFREVACYEPIDDDILHYWPVGIYVP